jgi:hypothetical protein
MKRSNAATAIGSLVSERDWQRQLVDLAETLGYQWAHFRPAMRQSGHWSTPVSGGLGVGWPDLVLARPGRFVMVELKAEGAYLKPPQKVVHHALRAAGVDLYTWRPSDLELAAEVLR